MYVLKVQILALQASSECICQSTPRITQTKTPMVHCESILPILWQEGKNVNVLSTQSKRKILIIDAVLVNKIKSN